MTPEDKLEQELLKAGEILLVGEIIDDTVYEVIPKLRYINRHLAKEKPILFFIHSCGGDVDSAAAIIGEMDNIKGTGREIYTIGMGQVASAAIFILARGTRRFGYEYSSYMIHPCSYSANDSHKQNKQFVSFMDKYWNNLLVELALICDKKKNLTKFIAEVEANIWLDYESAVKFKLIEGQWPTDASNHKSTVRDSTEK